MRKTTAAIVAGLLSCSTVIAAEPGVVVPPGAGLPATTPAQPQLILTTLREEIRIPSRQGSWQTFDSAQVRTFDSAQQPPPDNKSWMERHPVWFGLIVGAGVGAGLGAASCGDGCFPIGASGAALVGSWYGAGAGALIGWGVGRAK